MTSKPQDGETPEFKKLIQAFESRHWTAILTDQRESATTASMNRDWSAFHQAKDALVSAITAVLRERDALRERVKEAERALQPQPIERGDGRATTTREELRDA